MANLTIAVDDEVLLRARKRALDQGTSVNAVLRDYLEAYAGDRARRVALQRFLANAERSEARSTGAWSRDELHER
ncbi:MAG: hypothetical protein AB7N70_09220 [Dehalococcoidia bacterium]